MIIVSKSTEHELKNPLFNHKNGEEKSWRKGEGEGGSQIMRLTTGT
jgi:hypothetical protein